MHLSGITAEDRPGAQKSCSPVKLLPLQPPRFRLPFKWSWRRDLNPRPSDYKSDALPAELRQLITHRKPVPETRKDARTHSRSAYHGTEIKVSIPSHPEQTHKAPFQRRSKPIPSPVSESRFLPRGRLSRSSTLDPFLAARHAPRRCSGSRPQFRISNAHDAPKVPLQKWLFG